MPKLNQDPEPAPEEQPAPEIRGGDRPADYIPAGLLGEAYVKYAPNMGEFELLTVDASEDDEAGLPLSWKDING